MSTRLKVQYIWGKEENKISGFAARLNKFNGLFPECTLGTVYGRLDWSKVAP